MAILSSGKESTFMFKSKSVKADAILPNIKEDAFQGARKNIIM